MKNNPLFRYSLNFKVFTFTAVLLSLLLIATGFAIRFDVTQVSIFFWILSIFIVFAVALGFFLHFVTFPLERISQEILQLLTGKSYKKVPPFRNDEIGVISHFFNTVIERVKDLADDISEGKRMSDELALAAQIQTDVLPKDTPDNIIGLDIIAKTRASSEVGGDCFDFLKQKNDTLIYIGDVTGHGVPAGLIMMLVSTTIRALVQEKLTAKQVLSKTNTILTEKISSNHFMSLVALRWQNDKQKMSFLGAGHEYILHYSMKDKKVHAIKSEGIALKMIPNIDKILKETDIDFQEGDSILLYTDGIIEARNHQDEMYGLERLRNAFLQNAYKKASDIFDNVTSDFSRFLGKNHVQQDDITMIVIKNIGQFGQSKKVQLTINATEESKVSQGEIWDWA